jgi:rfaE bifunctional protein nucleotidyltransferase chain/domain
MPDILDKIMAFDDALKLVKSWRSKSEKIVFTNGVFDILHPGHVIYLDQARALGTKLILGLNSDASAKAQGKGPNRPINDENSRATVLAGLASVDLIVKFNDPTPLSLIETILPNVLVKGGDYSLDQIVGAEIVTGNGGVVKSIPFVEGSSTTSIEQKILKGVKTL